MTQSGASGVTWARALGRRCGLAGKPAAQQISRRVAFFLVRSAARKPGPDLLCPARSARCTSSPGRAPSILTTATGVVTSGRRGVSFFGTAPLLPVVQAQSDQRARMCSLSVPSEPLLCPRYVVELILISAWRVSMTYLRTRMKDDPESAIGCPGPAVRCQSLSSKTGQDQSKFPSTLRNASAAPRLTIAKAGDVILWCSTHSAGA